MQVVRTGNWQLYGQGGANKLFESDEYPRKLLRVRKDLDIPSTKEVFEFMHGLGLNEYLPDTALVLIDPALVDQLGGKKHDNHGLLMDKLGVEEGTISMYNGVFVTIGDGEYSFEFKPKWLIWPPSSPKRGLCRTCALRKLRGKPESFCPLDLASGDRVRVGRAVEKLCPIDGLRAKLVDFFLTTEIFTKLIELQRLDQYGLLNYETVDSLFSKAMTARDATMIVHASHSGANVSAKLIDLDPKWYVGKKLQKLRETEEALAQYLLTQQG